MVYSTIPLSNILKSDIVQDYLEQGASNEFFIGDFGSGRNAEVPIFFTKELKHLVPYRIPSSTVYCVDMHTLRLENMFGQFLEEEITKNARVVFANIETMTSHASFPFEQEEYLKSNPHEKTSLDQIILNHNCLPTACFHLGILNKDIIGYLSEYYETDSNLKASLQSIHGLLRQNALLLVTQPCVMYRADNINILRDNEFQLEEIIDVDLVTGNHTFIDESASAESFSKPNHYSFIVASKM